MNKKPLILAIDDDPFYLNEIRLELEGHADCKLFQGPNEFEELVTKEDILRASLIVVDYDYGAGTAIKSGIAGFVRNNLGYKGKLVLCSLHEDFREDEKQVRKDYDVVMHKRDLSWERLEQCLN